MTNLIASIRAELTARLRRSDSRCRVPFNGFRFGLNGANGPRRRDCALCGARGVSWCGKYPQTKQAIVWEAKHAESCSAVQQQLAKMQSNGERGLASLVSIPVVAPIN